MSGSFLPSGPRASARSPRAPRDVSCRTHPDRATWRASPGPRGRWSRGAHGHGRWNLEGRAAALAISGIGASLAPPRAAPGTSSSPAARRPGWIKRSGCRRSC